MILNLIHDPLSLSKRATPATPQDLSTATDLLDTLLANREECVGMAANMIGEPKAIIAFLDESGREPTYTVMLNPKLLKQEGAYSTEESCLSLLGGPRPCRRYRSVKVEYQTLDFKTRVKTYSGFTAQIIQHEIDHLNGVLI